MTPLIAGLALICLVVGACRCPADTSITISEGENQVRVILLADDVVRIRVGPGGVFPNDHNPEYAVIKTDDAWPGAADRSPDADTIETGTLRLAFTRAPLALTVYDRDGRVLIGHYTIDFSGPRAAWDLAPDEHVYGSGDKKNDLDKRGTRMDIWNVDTDYQDQSTGLMGYKSIAMYWSSRGYGVYLHNWWRSSFDMGQTRSDRVQIAADGGELDFYLFCGPSFKQIVNRYTELTGRPALLPTWVFGYHQGGAENDTSSRWAAEIAARMRERGLPIDAVYYDDVDPATFAEGFAQDMWDRFHVRITAGYGMPWAEEGTALWDEMNALTPRGLIVDAGGRAVLHEGNGMDVAFSEIDFFSPAASDAAFRAVWAKPLRNGVWNGMLDFGELDFVPDPENTFFPYFTNPKRSVEEMHNIYALAYAEQMMTREADYTAGVKKKSRPIGYCRPGTAGCQRYGWTSTGDSESSFEGLRAHTRGALNLTMSGYSAVGTDIGGWMGVASDEVYARWFEAGTLMPFAWAHGQGGHAPYLRPSEIVNLCRRALERRYRLLPYLYSLNFESSQNGTPMMRTLAFETECEPGTENIGDEWFLGPFMLVAPVVDTGWSRTVFLPSGRWFDYADGKTIYGGGRQVAYQAGLRRTPIFIKAGAIIPTGPVMQYSSEKPADPLTLDVYPSQEPSSFVLFEDDGEYGYERGRYSTTRYECVEEDGTVTLTIHGRDTHGGYAPERRQYVVRVHGRQSAPPAVRLNGEPCRQWSYEPAEEVVTVSVDDDGGEKTLVIDPGA